VKKRVSRHVHGRNVKVTVKSTKKIAEPLLMPATMTGQNGAVIHQPTKISVTGCPRARKAGKKSKARHVKKEKK